MKIKGGFKLRDADADCLNCSAQGVYLGQNVHGSYTDHNFSCDCGAQWVFITEQGVLHRMQLVYPKD